MGQTVADEGLQGTGRVLSFFWTLPGEMTKRSRPSLYINYQLLSQRHFVKEINETTSGQEQIRLQKRGGKEFSLGPLFLSWGSCPSPLGRQNPG